jgi:deoxynucleotidyltransferase terminal-interacting protein 1
LDPGKWSTDKLSSETQFVLGVNVNKALGHAANRGKVYILHPELFKYVCDGDDKTWLYDNKHLPVHGGKAFLLIYDEVESLVKTESSYKDNPDILKCVQKLQKFSVPQFMENKMKEFVRNVQGACLCL